MMLALSVDSVAQAQVARIAASLVVGSGVAIAGALALRLSSRISAATRYTLALLLMLSLAFLVFRPAAASEVISAGAGSVPVLHLATAWARYIFFAWAALAFVGLLRVGFGILRLQRLKKASRLISINEVPPAVIELLSKARRFGRPIALYASDRIQVPAAIGFLRPAVVLPEWMIGSTELSEDDLRALMLHELAHLARWDDWVNLIQKLVKAVMFFHPAVWWLDLRICAEREMACDDAVLLATRDAHGYARCLARVAEQTYVRRTLALAQAAVGHLRLTSRRVRRLLARPNEKTRGWKPTIVVSIFGALAVAGAFCRTPEFVTFGSPVVARVNVARTNSMAAKAQLPKSDVVLAAANLRSRLEPTNPKPLRTNAIADQHSAVKRIKAKAPSTASPSLVHLAAHVTSDRTSAQAFFVLIQSREELPGFGTIQIETWRVVLISNAPPAHTAFPHKEI